MKTIIEMAREAGIIHPEMVDKTLERFAALVRADEREVLALPEERNFCPRFGTRTADLTTIHTCTPPHDNALQRGLSKTKEVVAGSQAFYGFPHGPVSTPNAGGKCVTAGETAPKEST